jgi:hypothetical protein
METGEVIINILLTIMTIVSIYMNSIISDDNLESRFVRIIFSVFAINCFSFVMYSVGELNTKYDLYYKIDNNISIKNTIDFKEYKLKIQKALSDENKKEI